MQYQKILPGIFLSRPNRFVARVEVDGEEAVCHVKNTGRCRELLVPGARIYLEECRKPGRKTAFDLIAVEKGDRLINMDAQAPNRVFGEWARAGTFLPGLTLLRPETTFGGSRFDFYWEAPGRRGFVEVKGVTLEEDGVVRFPDAPTLRGVKHLGGAGSGHGRPGTRRRCALWSRWRACSGLSPTTAPIPPSDRPSGRPRRPGVEVLALDCRVTPDRLELNRPVPVAL